MFIHLKAAQSFLISGSVTSISICVNKNVLWKYVICFGLPSIKNLNTSLCRTISTAFKSNKNDNKIALVFISGGEGSRTPVQYLFHYIFYKFSPLLIETLCRQRTNQHTFLPTKTQTIISWRL